MCKDKWELFYNEWDNFDIKLMNRIIEKLVFVAIDNGLDVKKFLAYACNKISPQLEEFLTNETDCKTFNVDDLKDFEIMIPLQKLNIICKEISNIRDYYCGHCVKTIVKN